MDQLNTSLVRVKVGKEEPMVKVDLRPEQVNDDQENLIIEEETENTTLEGTYIFVLITIMQ